MFARQKKNLGRYSSQNIRPKSSTKFPKVNNTPYQVILKKKNEKERDSSMRISLPLDSNHNKNKYNALNSFHYQGTLTCQNFAGTDYFTYFPDYKNPHINHNLRKMICEQDKEIAENYEVLKDLWEKLGVTEKYINNFDFMINAKCHNRESILEMLYKEKKQMKRFRIELMKVISEINKRENQINELKQYIEAYKEIKMLNQMKESKNIDNIEDVIRLQNISSVNKDLIEKDIHECLKSIRLRTINVVNKVKKFETLYTELIKAKINMKIIKAKYGFDFNYLKKIKHDLDFLKDSEINNLYHFSPNGGDPFLLNISDKLKDPNDLQQYMSLPISNELLSIVKTYMFKLDTGDDETTTNMNTNTARMNNVDKLLSNKNISNMAAMNSISDINNLRMQLQVGDAMLGIEEEKDKIKGMTSRQLIRHLQRYGRIKRELYPPFNKDLIKEQIQNRIIARIENKISILENEFNIKINEKYRKKEKLIKDEEQTLMNEKNRIEQVGKQEEEERQKREQDYLISEKERTKRKNNDKKIREENASFMKRDNNIYITEMEMKCMDDVNGKLKEGREKDLVMKREQIENIEEKQRERKEELDKIRKISDDESESEESSDSEEESQTHKKRKKKKDDTDSDDDKKKKKKKDKNKDSENDNDNKKDSKNESKDDSKKDSKNESKNEEDESDEDEDDDDSKSKSKSRKTKSKKKNSSKDDDEDEDDDDDDDDKDDDEDDD